MRNSIKNIKRLPSSTSEMTILSFADYIFIFTTSVQLPLIISLKLITSIKKTD